MSRKLDKARAAMQLGKALMASLDTSDEAIKATAAAFDDAGITAEDVDSSVASLQSTAAIFARLADALRVKN